MSEKNDGRVGVDRMISVLTMHFSPSRRVTDDAYLLTYNVFRLGDIAFEGNRSRYFKYGRMVENDIGDGIISHVFEVFRPRSDSHDLLYWRYAINNERVMRRVLVRATKAATMMHNVVPADFLREPVAVPQPAEQQLVGELLDTTDRLISLHQRRQN